MFVKNNEAVLLLHGLAETSWWMMPLACALRAAGYEPVLLDFPSTRYPIESLIREYLDTAIEKLPPYKKLHFIGHSLGSVMIRSYLQHNKPKNTGRFVMMAPGNHGSPVLSVYKHLPLYKFFLGPAGIQSAADDDSYASALSETMPVETGIIAGCVPLDPLSIFSMPWPHDGKTTVEDTRLAGMTDHITLFTAHDLMMFDPVAIYQAVYFLRHGHFSHHTPQGRRASARALAAG